MTTATTSTATTSTALPTGTWNVDPVHSHVGFAVDYMIGTFRGSFSPIQAQLQVDGASARLTGAVPVSGVRVQDENLGAHLQSPDFFDAERAPQISFTSTDITRSGSDVSVRGELRIKGITRPVQLHGTIGEPTEDPFGGVRFRLELETTIDRTEFGIRWNNPLPSGKSALANDVALTAELNLVRA
jgi:polyisoprenoid-binding protein YceI